MSIDRGVDKDVVHINSGILFNHKKHDIIPFAATWMDLYIYMMMIPSELSQTKKNI